ncbi:MAG TPA: cytochrome c [Gammaproteobacteria bacterium]|nr:cytochrome c [Gammaproteobacteria bacterium]
MNTASKQSKVRLSVVIFTLCLFTAGFCNAGDIGAGKTRAAACVGCHGMQGISVAPNYPNLAGQKEKYLASAINSYRSGGRNDPTMKAMVASLSDDDVANLAAYFSSLASN